MPFQYTREMCFDIARTCAMSVEFRRKNGSAYNKARQRGWFKDYTWFVDGRHLGLNGRWTDETCAAEARKYSRKVDFQRMASGAYKYAAAHGLLQSFAWFENSAINLEVGKIYCVYRYVFDFVGRRYVYIGLTMRPKIRDKRHREGDSSVYDFAKKHGVGIPPMEIIQSNLTQEKARELEDFFRRVYEGAGDVVLNRAKTGVGIGSVGGMHKKWSRKACETEARKFTSRGAFEKGSPSAYQVALYKKWIDDYTWFKVVHHKAWTKESFLKIASKYSSIKELQAGNNGAYISGRIHGWIDLCTWFVPGQGWSIKKPRLRKDSKPICQYTLDGEFVARHENLVAALRASGVMSLRKCLIGERKQAGGFVWRYADLAGTSSRGPSAN